MSKVIAALATVAFVNCAPVAPSPTATVTPTPVAASPGSARPRVASTNAAEDRVTITYDRPMKHALACGASGLSAGQPATIDGLEMNITSRYYTSPDTDFDEMWSELWVATVSSDCKAVTFTFVHGIGPGSYPLRIVRVQDQAGNALDPDPTTVTVNVAESGPPRINLVQYQDGDVLVQFSEAIKPALATDVARYRVGGRAPAAGSTATCPVRTCARVTLHLANPPARVPDDLTVVGLQDLAGNGFAPGTETQPISLSQGQVR